MLYLFGLKQKITKKTKKSIDKYFSRWYNNYRKLRKGLVKVLDKFCEKVDKFFEKIEFDKKMEKLDKIIQKIEEKVLTNDTENDIIDLES